MCYFEGGGLIMDSELFLTCDVVIIINDNTGGQDTMSPISATELATISSVTLHSAASSTVLMQGVIVNNSKTFIF